MMFDPLSSTPFPNVIKGISRQLPYFFINPLGLHALSMKSKEILVKSRGIISDFLGCANLEVIFTSSSTESNNLAIKGCLFDKVGSIITTDFEHSSIIHPLKTLEKQGFRVIYIPTDSSGWVEPQKVKEYMDDDTLLITMGAVCRETATLRDVKGILKVAKESKPDILCHFDFWGVYYPDSLVNIKDLDMASFDSLSLLGPLGVGFLYIKKGIRLKPLIEGGTQERGLRAGEENLFGIYTLAQSIKVLVEWREAIESNLKTNDHYLEERMFLPPIFKKGCKAPGLFSYGLKETSMEVLASFMERGGIFLGYSSPCMVSGLKKRIKQKAGFEDALSFRIPPFTSLKEVSTFLNHLSNILARVEHTL
ncbi:MAG: aminotransferase class V-fold PLP-dependent enzyme [Hydrogenobacter sp.]